MSKKTKSRRNRKLATQQKLHASLSAQELFDRKDFQGAINVLSRINQPSDDQLRLLLQCHINLSQFNEALSVVFSIKEPSPHDFLLMAWTQIRLAAYDKAENILGELVRFHQNGEVYYWLATAQAKGNYYVDEPDRTKVVETLNKAVAVKGGRIESFTWLEKLLGWDETDKKIAILQKALDLYPQSDEVRLRLAQLYTHSNNLDKSLEVLDPLLQKPNPSQQALWWAFYDWDENKNLEKSLQYLDAITPDYSKSYSRHSDIVQSLITGDVFARNNKFDDALSQYEKATKCEDESLRALGFVRKAWINVQTQNIDEVINNFTYLSDLVLKSAVSVEENLELYFGEGSGHYDKVQSLLPVCRFLLQHHKNGHSLVDNNIKGRVFYVLHLRSTGEGFEELESLLPAQETSLLTAAAELLKYPPLIGDQLAWHFATEDLPLAVKYHLEYCLWYYAQNHECDATFSPNTYPFEDQIAEQIKQNRKRIHEVAFGLLRACTDKNTVKDVFCEFYDDFWRDVIFNGEMFNEVIEVCTIFVDATGGEEGLFDYAYSLNAVGNRNLAEEAYKRLLVREPQNASALNNLGAIAERNGQLQAAYDLYSQAQNLDPKDELFARNKTRITNIIQSRKQNDKARQTFLRKALAAGLSAEKYQELNNSYWESDMSTTELQRIFGVSRINQFITPLIISEACPNCGALLSYKNRTARTSDDKACISCGHTSNFYSCRCDYCQKIRAEEKRRVEEERIANKKKEFEENLKKVSDPSYVSWALTNTTRKEKVFLKAYVEIIQENDKATWEDVCDRAGVVGHKKYLEKLINVGLILNKPEGGYGKNPSVDVSMIDLPTVRKITPSIRFDVFQRDNHTCQYCGRKPPNVELVVDHLNPVAHGGTDAFDNLITSCEECNSGKSAKLIKDFTGGFSRDEWRERLKVKRLDMLRARRARVDEVIQYWSECRNARRLSEYELEGVHSFIEKYDPDWIKRAIFIASKRKPSNYVKYVAGTLRNWAKNGPPEKISNPDAPLERKKATEKPCVP